MLPPRCCVINDPKPDTIPESLHDLVDTDDWPPGTRLIVRREPRHRGAQRSLFPSDAYRYWGHWTDHAGGAVALDAHMRAHAHVEDHIKRLKSSGLTRMPFNNLTANTSSHSAMLPPRCCVINDPKPDTISESLLLSKCPFWGV